MAYNESEWSVPIEFFPHHIENHVDQANKKMLAQYQNKPIFKALIQAGVGSPAQRQAALLRSLLEMFDIDNAVGVTLANIGRIVGQGSLGKSDAVFRNFIKARIARNTSRGIFTHIVSAWKLLTGSTVVSLTPIYPAGILIQGNVAVDAGDIAYFKLFIEAVIAAGVELDGFGVIPEPEMFGFDPGSDGFSVDGTTGGGKFYNKQFGS